MSDESAEGLLSRQIRALDRVNPEQASMVMRLIVNLGSPLDYDNIGSFERDAQARDTGEFEKDFVYPELQEECPPDIYKEIKEEMDSLYAA